MVARLPQGDGHFLISLFIFPLPPSFLDNPRPPMLYYPCQEVLTMPELCRFAGIIIKLLYNAIPFSTISPMFMCSMGNMKRLLALMVNCWRELCL